MGVSKEFDIDSDSGHTAVQHIYEATEKAKMQLSYSLLMLQAPNISTPSFFAHSLRDANGSFIRLFFLSLISSCCDSERAHFYTHRRHSEDYDHDSALTHALSTSLIS